MARIARVVAPGLPHHGTQRGNRRMQTFFCDDDYAACPSEQDDRELLTALRRRESTGRPLGDEPFLKRIGRLLGRDLVPKKPGPAPKNPAKKKRR